MAVFLFYKEITNNTTITANIITNEKIKFIIPIGFLLSLSWRMVDVKASMLTPIDQSPRPIAQPIKIIPSSIPF